MQLQVFLLMVGVPTLLLDGIDDEESCEDPHEKTCDVFFSREIQFSKGSGLRYRSIIAAQLLPSLALRKLRLSCKWSEE